MMKLSKKEMKMLKLVVIIAAALVVIGIVTSNNNGGSKPKSKKTKYTIFGSISCPWTVKALDLAKKEGHDHEYVDCKKGKCPDFVNGFPTYKHHGSGNVSSGYTESPLLI